MEKVVRDSHQIIYYLLPAHLTDGMSILRVLFSPFCFVHLYIYLPVLSFNKRLDMDECLGRGMCNVSS
jgi:hypothetical protein